MRRRALLMLACLPALAGCGLRPLYGAGGAGPVAQTLRNVEVAPIPGRAGWLLRTELEDRLGASEGASRYRLQIAIDDRLEGLGVRADDAVTRERRTLRARFQLIEAATGQVVLDDTRGSDVGIDVVGSQYATVAAEQTALERLADDVADQIVARLATYARNAR